MTEPGLFHPGDLAGFITTKYLPKPGEVLGWRVCRPDFRSRDGFRWPFPGGVAIQKGPKNGQDCGEGLHIAKTWAGAASGGLGSSLVIIVSYHPGDVLGEGGDKVRVRRAKVLDALDPHGLIRNHKAKGANLAGADLARADLSGADLSGTYLSGTYLAGANLSWTDLAGADLAGADLARADLSWADLSWANLSGANLSRANLSRANLSGANLSRANLSRANLSRADLSGADLSGAYGRDDWADLTARGAIRN